MPKQRLASMSVDALLKLRNDISGILSRRVEALRRELRSLGEDYKEVGRIAIYGKKSKKASKAKIAKKAKAAKKRRGSEGSQENEGSQETEESQESHRRKVARAYSLP